MKFFLNAISILFCLVLLVSCQSRKPVEPEKIIDTRTVKEVIRDTVFQTSADSTFYNAWIECVNGKPVLREPLPKKNNSKTETKPKAESKNALQKPKVKLDEKGNLSVECYKEVEEIKAQLKNTYEERLKEHQKPVYIEKELKWYHKTLMWLGGIFLLIIVIASINKIKN